MRELAHDDSLLYEIFFHFTEIMFNMTAERDRSYIEKTTTLWRKFFDSGLYVAITFIFLATGISYKALGYTFRVTPNTIFLLVTETSKGTTAASGG